MERKNILVRSFSIILVISMVFGAIPYFTMASESSGQVEIELNYQEPVTYELGITEIMTEEEPLEVDSQGVPISNPFATLEAMYADSAQDQASSPVPEAAGTPDDIRFTFGGNANYVRASGSTWGSGSGTITSVEIAAEWSSSGLIDDGAIIQYYDSGIGLLGITKTLVDATNYATDNTLYLDITADKEEWTWTDIGNINPEIYYFKAGGPEPGTLSVDALWIRVQYESISLEYNIPVDTGWNLISLPSVPQDTNILSVLDDAGGDTTWNRVKCYDQSLLNPWESHSIYSSASVNTLSNLNRERGIWVNIMDPGSDGELVISGSPVSTTAISLYAGWNLVGYPCLESKIASSALVGVPYDGLESFDIGTPYLISEMLPSEIMSPGNGYWIHVTSDYVWNIGDTTAPTFAGLVSATDAVTGGTVDLSWDLATDPSYPILYNVYMATSSGGQDFGTPDYITDQTNLQISGLTDNQEYFFVVRAEDSAGNEDTNTVENSAIPTSPDAASPWIISTVPADGTLDIPITQEIVITFNEAMDTGTVAYSCLPNPGGLTPVWSAGDTVLTLFHTDFAYDMLYTVEVTAGNDLAGNPLVAGPVPNPWTFTTLAAPDVTSPWIVTTVPVDGATDIVVGQSIVITFSESIDTGTFTFTCTPEPGGWGETWGAAVVADDQVTLTHADFATDTVYTIEVTAADDIAGNPLIAGPVPNPWSFTTETAPDLTGPVTSGIDVTPNPTAGAGTVTLTATVDDSTTGGSTITEAEYFVDSVGADGSGIAMTASDGTFNAISEGVEVIIDVSGWADGTYTLYVHGRDSAGNWGATISIVLSVTSAPDTIPPQVVSNIPSNGATGVVVSTDIVVTFTEEMNQANTEGAFAIVPAIAGTFTWNPAGDTLTFNPSSDLAYATTYTITILTAATDLAGNTLDGDKDGTMEGDNKDKWVFSFTTENEPDLTGPIVSNVLAIPDPITAGAILTLTADIDDSTTGGSDIAEAEWSTGGTPAGAGSGTNMAATDGGFDEIAEAVTASIDTTGWPAGTETLWVRGRDSQGNWGDAVSTSIVVEGPDIIPPQVVSNVPSDGAIDVDISTDIVVTFTEEMDQANTQGAFSIVPATAGTFSWNAGGDVLTFNPSSDLAGGDTYTITILIAATDLVGNTLDGDKDGVMEGDNKDKWVFSFTTVGGGTVEKYAVVVGISDYINNAYIGDLQFCDDDAAEIRTSLLGAGYAVDLITDKSATKSAITGALASMAASEVAGDYVAFTYSGHGGTSTGKYFICPADCTNVITTMLTKDEMQAEFDAYDSTHALIFFDSCNSGGLSSLSTPSGGTVCIMAAAANQYSWDGAGTPLLNNGVWTYYFWEDGYRNGGAGSLVIETVFDYAKP
ncbi:MAG: Ig-like domain-containing protein, partial [Thermoplasmata archaeon]|nr:Ig-like domain-containing protein [Thermoplasmata archaeon]